MQTPYGDIPQRLVKDMSAQEMHDYLRQRYSRRRFLKGAATAGAVAAAGPVFWSRTYADASAAGSPAGPQWIAFGPDPATEMHISVAGSGPNAGSTGTPCTPPATSCRRPSTRRPATWT